MIDIRHLVSSLTENQEAVRPIIQALQLRGWKPSGSDSVKKTVDDVVIQAWIYAAKNRLYAYGQATSKSSGQEIYIDEISQQADEDNVEFADRLDGEFQSINAETFAEDPEPESYQKSHPMDRF